VFRAEVIVNKEEAGYLQRGENIIPRGTNLFTRFIVNFLVPALKMKLDFEPCQPDIIADKPFDLRPYGFNAYILHTPGHSPGSQSVIIDDEIALTGDTMFGVFPGSIFPPFADKKDELITSWSELLETKCFLFLPSHGTANSRELLQHEFLEKSKS
jgi:hydroxyacylglutathione hydrolase